MTPEQQLVQQIRELIRNSRLERTPVLEDISERYADLCHDLNERLLRCAEYLDKGMRSEAVHEAQSPPPLLELVETVQFDELQRWRNITRDLDLMSFPEVPADVVARLREESLTEQDLAPLLKEYRRHVYQGDRDQAIRVLRQLRVKDPGNPSWPENLEPLEEDQLEDLLDEADEALEANDLSRLRRIEKELTHPQRIVEPPEDVLEQVRDALNAERRAEAQARAQGLVNGFKKALQDQDADTIAELLLHWDELSADPAVFKPPEPDAAIAEQARAWYADIAAARQREEDFRRRLTEFRNDLHAGALSAAEVTAQWEEIRSSGLRIPAELEADVEAALRDIARRRTRRRQLLTVTAVGVIAALAAAAGLLLHQRHVQQRRSRIVLQLENLLRQQKYSELRTTVEALKRSDPAFHNGARVQHFDSEAAAALAQQASMRDAFEAAMDALSMIRRDGFQAPEERIRHLLDEARRFAYSDEVAQQIQAWEDSWSQWRQRRTALASENLERITAHVQEALAEKDRQPFDSTEAEARAIAAVDAQLADAEPFLEHARTDAVDAYNAVCVKVDTWKRDYEQRVHAMSETAERLASLRTDIDRALPDIQAYGDLLEAFVQEFPNEPEAPHYRRALTHLDGWLAAVALEAFRLDALPPAPETTAQLQAFVSPEGVLRGSVWEPDVRRCLDYAQAIEQVAAKIPLLTLSKEETINLQMLYYKPKDEEEWRKLYFPKPLVSRVETDEEGNQYRAYWGMVYHFDTSDQAPWLVHTSKIFPNMLNTRDFDIRIQHRAQDNLVGHGRFLYRFVAQAGEVRELDVHLLHGIKELRTEEAVELVPRAWLLKRLVHFLAESFPDTIPEAVDMVRIVDTMNTDVPWINAQHPAVIAAREQIRKTLETFPDIDPIVERLRLRRGLLALTLSRRVRCVGRILTNREGDSVPQLLTTTPPELWILQRSAPGARPVFKIAGRAGPDGDPLLDPETRRELFPGQLLFAPRDGRRSSELLRGFVGDQDRDILRRPASWPINAW